MKICCLTVHWHFVDLSRVVLLDVPENPNIVCLHKVDDEGNLLRLSPRVPKRLELCDQAVLNLWPSFRHEVVVDEHGLHDRDPVCSKRLNTETQD